MKKKISLIVILALNILLVGCGQVEDFVDEVSDKVTDNVVVSSSVGDEGPWDRMAQCKSEISEALLKFSNECRSPKNMDYSISSWSNCQELTSKVRTGFDSMFSNNISQRNRKCWYKTPKGQGSIHESTVKLLEFITMKIGVDFTQHTNGNPCGKTGVELMKNIQKGEFDKAREIANAMVHAYGESLNCKLNHDKTIQVVNLDFIETYL